MRVSAWRGGRRDHARACAPGFDKSGSVARPARHSRLRTAHASARRRPSLRSPRAANHSRKRQAQDLRAHHGEQAMKQCYLMRFRYSNALSIQVQAGHLRMRVSAWRGGTRDHARACAPGFDKSGSLARPAGHSRLRTARASAQRRPSLTSPPVADDARKQQAPEPRAHHGGTSHGAGLLDAFTYSNALSVQLPVGQLREPGQRFRPRAPLA